METGAMTDEEYMETQGKLAMVAVILANVDLPAFLSRISLAETMGPVLDPTLYMTAGEKLGRVRLLAESALSLRKESRRKMRLEERPRVEAAVAAERREHCRGVAAGAVGPRRS